jgi:hypothetical protein
MSPPRRWWLWGIIATALRVDPSVASHGDSDEAWIAVRNRRGEQRGLFQCSVGEASTKRERVEAELRELPLNEWCNRYGVPLEFAGGE